LPAIEALVFASKASADPAKLRQALMLKRIFTLGLRIALRCGRSGAPPDSYRHLYDARMKTTLELNDPLVTDAKALAVQQRTSLTRLIEEGLQLCNFACARSRRPPLVAA